MVVKFIIIIIIIIILLSFARSLLSALYCHSTGYSKFGSGPGGGGGGGGKLELYCMAIAKFWFVSWRNHPPNYGPMLT